jgi:hypothetical protein
MFMKVFFWGEFFGRIFLGEILGRNFLGGTFWEEFFVYIVKVI